MKLYADVTQLQATDFAVLLPMLNIPSDTAVGKLVQVLDRLPKERLHEFLNTVSGEDILDIQVENSEFYLEELIQKVLLDYREKCAIRMVELQVI